MPPRTAAEQVLIRRLRAGDPSAVAELVATYGPKAYQLAFRHTRNREDAEEIAQDVLVKVCRKIASFRGDAALSSWFYRITFNTAMSRLRTAKLSPPAEVSEDACTHRRWHGATDRSSPADELYLRTELRNRLADAINGLPRLYRTAVLLRDIHGLSTEEASQVLRVNRQTLKSRLRRGHLYLRERLSDFSGGLSPHRAA